MPSLQQEPAWGLLDARGVGCAEWLSFMLVVCALLWYPGTPAAHSQRHDDAAEALLATFSDTDVKTCARGTSVLNFAVGPSLSLSGHAKVCDAALERLGVCSCSVVVMQAPQNLHGTLQSP